MRRHLITMAAVMASLAPSAAPAAIVSESASTVRSNVRWVEDEMLVRFESGTSDSMRNRVLSAVGGTDAQLIEGVGVYRVHLPSGTDVQSAAARVSAAPRVQFAEPNWTGTIAGELLPDDRCFGGGCGIGRQWNLDAINAPAGWSIFPGKFYTQAERTLLTPIKVAVLDTKIDVERSDWRNADAGPGSFAYDARNGGQIDIEDAVDHLSNQQFTGPAAYHGTFVAGILGASANNTSDIAGVGYHAQIMPVTVVDGSGVVNAADLAWGIAYAAQRGAKVINMSLVMTDESDTVRSAIIGAASQSLLVAAAGNAGSDAPTYPAWYSGVMSVTGMTSADRPAGCSNNSAKSSVSAPGAGVLSLDPRTGVSVAGCGTSTAAPHVSGLAALLFAKNPSWTPDKVRSVIQATADDDAIRPGFDTFAGWGRINVERALASGATSAEVFSLTSTIPPRNGGIASVSALARSTDALPVLEARGYVGRVDPDTRFTFTAVDGAFDGTSEAIVSNLATTIHQAPGVTRIYVQARTSAGWGPSSSGALIIDRLPPTVKVVGSGPFYAVPAAGLPGAVTVTLSDDFSLRGSATLAVSRAYGDGSTVYTSTPTQVSFPSTQELKWSPALGEAGLYRVKVFVTDEAGNTSQATTDMLVVG